jgi:translation initiation factor 3 subunit B
MLAKEDQKRVRKNLREYSKQFDEEDAAEESNVSAELLAHRKRLIDEWNAWRSKRAKELAAEKQSAGTVEQKTDDGDLETVEEIVEDILEETEQIED